MLEHSVRRTLRGNVWSVRTTSGWYHRVRLTLHGVAIASCRLPSRDIAVRARAEIVAAAEHAAATGGDAEAVLRAVHVAGSSFQVRSGGLGLCYQAVLDARRCTGGHRLHSKTVQSMEEAIFLRRTVADVREAGLRHLGQIFNNWSQEPRHQKGRRLRRCLPRDEAEAYAERALKRAEAREARRSARAEGQAERLRRLSARAEAALRCVTVAAQASMRACRGMGRRTDLERWTEAPPPRRTQVLSPVKRARAPAELSLTQGPSTGAGTMQAKRQLEMAALLTDMFSDTVENESTQAPDDRSLSSVPETSIGGMVPAVSGPMCLRGRLFLEQERDSLRSRSKEGRPGSRKHRRYTHSVDLVGHSEVNTLRRVMSARGEENLPEDVDGVEEDGSLADAGFIAETIQQERPRVRPSAFYRLLECEGPGNALEAWAAAESRGRSPKRARPKAGTAQGPQENEGDAWEAEEQVRRAFRENWQFLAQSQSSQELIAKLEELTEATVRTMTLRNSSADTGWSYWWLKEDWSELELFSDQVWRLERRAAWKRRQLLWTDGDLATEVCIGVAPSTEPALPRRHEGHPWIAAPSMQVFLQKLPWWPDRRADSPASSVGHKEYSPPPSKDSVDAKRLVTVDFAATETVLAFYRAKCGAEIVSCRLNTSDRPIIGVSVYHMIPAEAEAFHVREKLSGLYFNKRRGAKIFWFLSRIQCFCFDEQLINPGEEVDLPIFFFIATRLTVWSGVLWRRVQRAECCRIDQSWKYHEMLPKPHEFLAEDPEALIQGEGTRKVSLRLGVSAPSRFDHVDHITLSYLFFESDSELPDEYEESEAECAGSPSTHPPARSSLNPGSEEKSQGTAPCLSRGPGPPALRI
ncbi:Cytochrome c oxidase assembly protein COX11, mitochondrial [Symbiodinium microadriaticum]|uniref:Cytochrome c oxidase assembly protein COX11, mitochondrial n=1 Tax=Symbiodinium microadriaticum TaxID=2951 RepID=A0A1Q9CBV4_SYMMI|nr:Cytochrome c oxidase assembly protein COX11, mitochondrial [Symbiodinium microadriaticum]